MILVERLTEEIESIRRHRYQFLLIHTQPSNDNELYRAVNQLGIPSVNINLELALRLREMPIVKRIRGVKEELLSIVYTYEQEIIYLNRIHYLFDEQLQQNPIGLIEYISGNKVILVNWPGEIKDGLVKYGTPDHPEYFEAGGLAEHIIQV